MGEMLSALLQLGQLKCSCNIGSWQSQTSVSVKSHMAGDLQPLFLFRSRMQQPTSCGKRGLSTSTPSC